MNTPEEQALRETLRGRAGGPTPSPIAFDDVRRQARTIHRRRVAGGVVAVAAAIAAVAVPGSIMLSQQTGGPVPPIATNPSTTAPSPTPDRVYDREIDLDPATLPAGPPPGVPYLVGRTLMLPGDESVELPAVYGELAPYDDGWLGVRSGTNGTRVAEIITEDGQVIDSFLTGQGIAVSHDGRRVAFVVAPTTRLVLHDNATGTDTELGEIARLGAAEVVGIVGGAGREVVLVNDMNRTRVYTRDGEVDGPDGRSWSSTGPGGLVTYIDEVKADLTTCTTTARMGGATPPSFETLDRTCEIRLDVVDGSGSLAVTRDTYGSGIGDVRLGITEVAGRQVATWLLGDRGYVRAWAWESTDALLATVFAEESWRVVRLRVDGTAETAVGPVEGNDVDAPFGFITQP